MIKTYCTHHGSLTTYVSVGGRKRCIDFELSHRGGTGYFTTGDEVLQQAIEADPNFGSKVSLYRSVSDRVPADTAEEERPVVVADGVTTWQEAADYLIRYYGASPSLKDPSTIRRKARVLGVSFPVLEAGKV